MGILLSKGSRSCGSEIQNEAQALSAFSLTLWGGDLYVRDPNVPVLHRPWCLQGGSGLLVPLSHCSILSTLLSSGLATAAADTTTEQHCTKWTEYGLQQTRTMFHATTLLSKLCIISVITPICTSYRVLYNIYCEVYQESNQKLFKLIALRVLKSILYYCVQCSVQQATIRKYFQFSFFELSNFRI